MKNQTITFSTGTLIINDKSISFNQKTGRANNVNTIARENIGHTDLEPMRLLTKVDLVYGFQTAAIGFVLGIIGLVIAISSNVFFLLYLGMAVFFFGAFLVFSVIWLDGLLGLNVAKPILFSIFGKDAMRIVVQNIYGGNNLQFFILPDEKSKIPKFEDYKLDKIYNVDNVKNSDIGKNNIDDIEKLATLKDKGILSQEEFDLKKKQILGL